MARDILMPQMGYDMTEGTVVRWVKKVGDRVRRGDVVAEIETDKATVEIEAFDNGTLLRILAEPGQTLPVGQAIATLGEPGEALPEPAKPSAASAPPPAAAPASPAAAPPPAPAPAPVPAPAAAGSGHAAPPPPPPVTRAPLAPGERPHASPLARRLAAQYGVDLSTIRGTGPGGRIVAADVGAAADAAGAPATTPAEPVAAPAPEPAALLPPLPEGASDSQPSRLRQTIARRMSESSRNAPHFYVAVNCQADALLGLRQDLAKKGVKVSVNDLLVKALATAALRHPTVNTAYLGGTIRSFKTVDVGIAVATEHGLLSPAIQDVGGKTIAEVAAASRDLAERARAGRLKPDEYGGGTITLSNLGMYGIDEFLAIINPPQALIISVGAAADRVVPVKGRPTVARVMTAWAAADHRVLDGAIVGEFMATFRAIVEDPSQLTT